MTTKKRPHSSTVRQVIQALLKHKNLDARVLIVGTTDAYGGTEWRAPTQVGYNHREKAVTIL